jgi:signal peptidase I
LKLGEGTFAALGSELLGQGLGLRCCTFGSSMFPLIKTGNIVEAETVGLEDLRVGDIVLYKTSKSTMVAHRLLKMTSQRDARILITKGDSVPWWVLEYVKDDQILGRLVSITWKNGVRIKLNGGLGRYLGIWLAILSPFTWCFYYCLKKI